LITHLKQQTLGNLSDISWREQVNFQSDDQGRIQDFKIRGGALKKIAPSGGRREHFWGIPCEKSRFYATNHIFPILGGAREIFGVFHVKNHDFTPKKIIFFPILGGARAGCAPPESAPALDSQPQVVKFTSCLSMVGSLRLLPPLKLVAMI
jgi:hypothetical protein